jgi:hypothetical protein
MNKGRQRPFAAIVQTHFDEALTADGRSVAVLESTSPRHPTLSRDETARRGWGTEGFGEA